MLSNRNKLIFIGMLSIIILGILVFPKTNNTKNKFEAASKPLTAMNETKEAGRPIYLEFYAAW